MSDMMAPQETDPIRDRARSHPSFTDALRFWLKLGFISFGGPAGQIAIMQTELVDRKNGSARRGFSTP